MHPQSSKGGLNMFGRRKGPSKPFIHQEGCKIAEVDPGVEIPWSYLGDGFWKAECARGFESSTEPIVDDRVRLDPLDPKTSRHVPQCEYVSESDPAVLKGPLEGQARDG